MCVIIYKPEAIDLKEKTLKKAWAQNPDGAGISFTYKNSVQVFKGLMTLNEFLNTYRDLKKFELVIHFRLATHGAVIPQFTHPFKIQQTHCELTTFNYPHVLHHNGILSKFGSKDLSDTVDYTNKILSKIKSIKAMKHVLSNENSKFALHTAKHVHLIGDFEKHKNCYFSNLYFLPENNTKWWQSWDMPLAKNKEQNPLDIYELFDMYAGEYLSNPNTKPDSFIDFVEFNSQVTLTQSEKNQLLDLLDFEAQQLNYYNNNLKEI